MGSSSSSVSDPSRRGALEWLALLAVFVGLALRVWEFSLGRMAYDDEIALLANLDGVPPFDFRRPLEKDQLAPPGFLALERLAVRLPMDQLTAGRLFPFACGLGAMVLMIPLARRYVSSVAVPIVAWVFALSDHVLYYSADLKPYSCDLVAAMLALWLADDPGRPWMRRALFGFGLIAPWFSFPVVFVLAGAGLHGIARRALARDGRGAILAILGCSGWLASFLGVLALSRAMMGSGDFLRSWWGFAFVPIPPKGWLDVRSVLETLANVFINPGSLLTPFGLTVTAVLASVLAIVGCVSLGLRWSGGLFLLLAPLVFTLAGSALRQYPFHGRLILSLVPTYQLLLAEGVARLGKRPRGGASLALTLVFLAGQASELVWNFAISQQGRSRGFDTHADLKNDLLDQLESRRRPRANHR